MSETIFKKNDIVSVRNDDGTLNEDDYIIEDVLDEYMAVVRPLYKNSKHFVPLHRVTH